MPNLDITKTYADGEVPFERDLDNIRDAILDLLNSTKLDSDNINDGSITTTKIADGAVTTTKIPSGVVAASKIAASAITAAKIADDAVTTAKILNDAVTTDKLTDDAVTRSKLFTRAVAVSSSSSGSFFYNANAYGDVTNLSVSFTATGRRVIIVLIPEEYEGTYSSVRIYCTSGSTAASSRFRCLRDVTTVGECVLLTSNDTATPPDMYWPPGVIAFVDQPSAGTYTYKIQVNTTSTLRTVNVRDCKLLVYEE